MSGNLEIQNNRIKVSALDLPLESPISRTDITLKTRGAINKVEFEDNQDGTWDQVHKFKGLSIEAVTENGDIVKSKDNRSHSKLLKGQIEMIRREKAPSYDEQQWYDRCMVAVRHNLLETLVAEGIV